MKIKLYSIALLATGIIALAGCSGKSCKDNGNCDRNCTETAAAATTATAAETVTYTGVLPAADAEGIDYTLTLSYDNATDGTYTLSEKYLGKSDAAFNSNGKFTLYTGTASSPDQKYIKLTPATTGDTPADELYFVVDNDSTITLTGANLKKADSPLNYSLTVKK